MPAILHPRLLELPERFETDKLVLRAYRAGDGAALFAAVNEDREDLSQWLPWVDNHQSVDPPRPMFVIWRASGSRANL